MQSKDRDKTWSLALPLWKKVTRKKSSSLREEKKSFNTIELNYLYTSRPIGVRSHMPSSREYFWIQQKSWVSHTRDDGYVHPWTKIRIFCCFFIFFYDYKTLGTFTDSHSAADTWLCHRSLLSFAPKKSPSFSNHSRFENDSEFSARYFF